MVRSPHFEQRSPKSMGSLPPSREAKHKGILPRDFLRPFVPRTLVCRLPKEVRRIDPERLDSSRQVGMRPASLGQSEFPEYLSDRIALRDDFLQQFLRVLHVNTGCLPVPTPEQSRNTHQIRAS